MFVIKKSRFGMIILHKDRSAATTKCVLDKVFAYAGCRPKIIRSDGAGEYDVLDPYLEAQHIHHQHSNTEEQFQNGTTESFGNAVGRGIRAMMLQSNLRVEFWGAAALYW